MVQTITFAGMGVIHQKVALQGVRFYAFHGYYEEEQLTGAEFIVDLETTWEVVNDGNDDLSRTVNYERLFEIVSEQMKISHKLIETLAHRILEKVRQEFIAVEHIKISIKKMNPPLRGEVKNSLVELVYNR